VARRRGFLLPVRVLSKLFRRLILTRLLELHAAGELAFCGEIQVLRASSGTASAEEMGGLCKAALCWSRGRARLSGPLHPQGRHLEPPADLDESIRRFLLHVLPRGFHRIRHYGLFASATRKANIAHVRQLLAAPQPVMPDITEGEALAEPWRRCPCCGGHMIVVRPTARPAKATKTIRETLAVTRHGLFKRPPRRR
jgi:hypothetical protein